MERPNEFDRNEYEAPKFIYLFSITGFKFLSNL